MIFEDHCVYVKRTREIMFLTLYADDILLVGSNLDMINATKQWSSYIFKTNDMGEARYVQGMEVISNRLKRLLGMCQKAYIKRVLKRLQIHHSNLLTVEKGLSLRLDQCPKTDKEKEITRYIPYAGVVESLMYDILCMQSNICFAVGLTNRYQSNPRPTHWQENYALPLWYH